MTEHDADRPGGATALRSALALALGLALLAAVAKLLGWDSAWEYRRAALSAEPWRALSGHLAHLSWGHWAANAVALVVLAALLAPWLSARAQAGTLVAASLGIAGTLALQWPEVAWYRGLSGALHGLFFAGTLVWCVKARPAARWLPAALLAGGAVKLVLEHAWRYEPAPLAWLGAPAVAPAHLAGALIGLSCGALVLLARR